MPQECLTTDSRELAESVKMLLEFWSTDSKSCSQPLELKKAELIMLACIALLNYLCTKSVHYSQAVADSETAAHELLFGEWRHNPNAQIPSVCLQGCNRSSVQAREIREEFLDCFITVTNGQVDWQWDMILIITTGVQHNACAMIG